jgi:hypothetical protein
MILDEKDIEELHAKGRGGRPLKPLTKPEAPDSALIATLRQMTSVIEQAAAKQAEPAVITLRPEITVQPTMHHDPPPPAPLAGIPRFPRPVLGGLALPPPRARRLPASPASGYSSLPAQSKPIPERPSPGRP